MLCQKDLQEDGWGGEGGTAGNIGGELGSIPSYPTFIPTGPKKLFCRYLSCLFGNILAICIFDKCWSPSTRGLDILWFSVYIDICMLQFSFYID